MAPSNPLVVALVCDGFSSFEFSCAAEVFGLPRPEFEPGWYRFETAGAGSGVIKGEYGLDIRPDAGLDRLSDAGTVIVIGWRDVVDAAIPDDLVRALRLAHGRGARLLSLCAGSFVLAATGLLDGKRATTHWCFVEAFRRRFPRVYLDPNVLYVDEGQIITSAGSAAALDACLHLVRRDFGSHIATQVARRLVVQPHRDGGQAQFIERPVLTRDRDRISSALRHMSEHLHTKCQLKQLARQHAMSMRTFMRRFKQKTGVTPVDWLLAARVDRARQLLEATSLSVEIIASECGLGTATNLRHHFRRRLGISPTEYRKRFGEHVG